MIDGVPALGPGGPRFKSGRPDSANISPGNVHSVAGVFAGLAGRVVQANAARIVVISLCIEERGVRPVLSRSNDLVDQTVPVLIIQVVNIPLVRIHVGDVTLPVHVSLVFARHLVPQKGSLVCPTETSDSRST